MSAGTIRNMKICVRTPVELVKEHLVDCRRNPAQGQEPLQLQDAEVGHTDAPHPP